MKCPLCEKEMIKGEVSIKGLGGVIYWVKEGYINNHPFKTVQSKKEIKDNGGVIISTQNSTISETLVAYNCDNCKKIVINY